MIILEGVFLTLRLMKYLGLLLGLTLGCLLIKPCIVQSQFPSDSKKSWLSPADSLDKRRLTIFAVAGGLAYASSFAVLNEYWYSQYPRGGFRFFNDWKEWNQMDKAGHVFGGYFQADWAYGVYRWMGYQEKTSIHLAMGTSLLMQTTIEVMDGFSKEWGFSWPDMASNVLGTALFGIQQNLWSEQKINMKVCSYRKNYTENPIVDQRAQSLFGRSYLERYLKDYNAQTIWLTTSVGRWMPQSAIPKWIGIGLGYGANHLMGGFNNQWEVNGQIYRYEPARNRQLYLSLDLDLEKLNTNRAWLKSTLKILNLFKIPLPGLIIEQGATRWCTFCF